MSDEMTTSVTEEAGSTALPEGAADKQKPAKSRDFLRSAMRDLREEEIDSPAARRFLIAEIERLDREAEDWRTISVKYNDLRVEFAEMKSGHSTNRWLEMLSFVSTTAGAAGLGAAPSYMSLPGGEAIGWVFAIGSVLLVLSGIIFRVMK